MTHKRLFLTVFGEVQGVGFRWQTMRKALELGLTGWVRNEPNGSVAILAEGGEERLQELKSWAEQGPSLARVERIEERWEDAPDRQWKTFDITYY